MKAVEFKQIGGSDVLEIVDVAEPTVGDGQVVVDVAASGLNPIDWKVRSGMLGDKTTLPFRTGSDLAGTVAAVGAGVTQFAVGDEVYGSAIALSGASGALAEQAVTKPEQLAKKPASLSLSEAAALPLAGVSALQALTEHIDLQAGHKILVTGAAGGIGSFAVVMGKTLGATVAATVRNDADATYVKRLGADVVVNVTNQSLSDLVKDYDAVYDTVGGEAYAATFTLLKSGSISVSMLGANEELAQKFGVTSIGQSTTITTERLTKLAAWVDEHQIKPPVTTFPFDQVKQAFEVAESGQIQGKAVVEFA